MISGIIGAVVGTLLLLILLRTVRPSARQSGSRFVLEYGRPMRALGIAMLLLGGFIAYAATRASANQRLLAWIVGGGIGACALYIFLEPFFVRVEFDDLFIYSFLLWRGTRRIPWSDIESYHYSESNRWYVIRTRTHGTLRVSSFLSGMKLFLERLHATRSEAT